VRCVASVLALALTCLAFPARALGAGDFSWSPSPQQERSGGGPEAGEMTALAERFLAASSVTAWVVEEKIRAARARGDAVLLEEALREVATLPPARRISEAAAHTAALAAAYGATGSADYGSRAVAAALLAAWRHESRESPVLATEAAETATALLRAGESTGRGELYEGGFEVLNFLRDRLVGRDGVRHAYDPRTGLAAGNGDLRDNALGGLAFVEAYRVSGEAPWLAAAEAVASFLRRRLEDRKFGGFFARNAAPEALPAPTEPFSAEKPPGGNALAALLLRRVGRAVAAPDYLEAARAARAVAARGGDAAAEDAAPLLAAIREWGQEPPPSARRRLASRGFLALLFLATLAGALSFLSPCTLPVLPAYFAFAVSSSKATILGRALAFFLGLALGFSVLGATATALGAVLGRHRVAIERLAGVAVALFGAATLLGKGFSGLSLRTPRATGFGGSFLFGLAFSVGWSTCVGPVLAAILVMAATREQALSGAALLFAFATGFGLPLVALSVVLGRLDRGGRVWRLLRGRGWELRLGAYTLHLHSTRLLSGALFLGVGFLLAAGHLSDLNRWLPVGLQAWVTALEDALLSLLN